MIGCPYSLVLERAFALLLNDGREEPGIVSHVESCTVCQSRLEAWAANCGGTLENGNLLEPGADSPSSVENQTIDGRTSPQYASDDSGRPSKDPSSLPKISGYEILDLLGWGGMGIVYKARHEKLNRIVALKMLHAGMHVDPDLLVRFQVEAEAVARLSHPNIIEIYDIGTAGGVPYIALEYVSGGSLEKKLGNGPHLPHAAAKMVATLAQGVHTAHLAGIVHRDLKPANVLLTEDGTPKVTDFGLAKRLEIQGQTQTGQIIGTPAYMAPEQARGESKAVGPGADIFALGAILYELLTGRPPFQSDSMMQTLQMVLQDEPVPPRTLAPGVPIDLETVCLKALRKDSRERYPTAQELADELNRFLHDEPVRARPLLRLEVAYRWCRRNPTMAGLLVSAAGLLLMIGVFTTLGVYHLRLQTAHAGEEEQRKLAENNLGLAQRYLYMNGIHLVDRSYHDNQMARARQVLEETSIDQRGWEWHYLDRITHAELLEVAGHTQAVHALAFPRHGAWMVSGSADRRLLFWDPRTGQRLWEEFRHTGPVWGVAVSPDGKQVASVAGSARTPGELIVWDITDGASPEARERIRFKEVGVGEQAAVAFHPTKPLLAVATGSLVGQSSSLLILDAKGGVVRRWQGPVGQGCVALAWSKDGLRLAASFVRSGPLGPSGQVVIHDPRTSEPVHRFAPHERRALALAYSEDGRTLATAGADQMIHLWGTSDHTLRQTLRGHRSAVNALTFTTGGGLISGSKDTTVRAWNLEAGSESFVRRGHESPVSCVAVDPRSGRIYSGSHDTRIKAWRPDQRQEVETYPLHKGAVSAVAFSPDGAAVISVGLDGAVWRIDPTGREKPRKLRQEERPLRQVRFLPDSQTLVVVGGTEEQGRDDGTIRLIDARDGRLLEELTTGLAAASSLSLSRDGERLAVVGQNRQQETVVQVWDLPTRRRRHLITVPTAIAAQLYHGGNNLIVLCERPNGFVERNYRLFDVSSTIPKDVMYAKPNEMEGRFALFTADESLMFAGGLGQMVVVYQVRPGGGIDWTGSLRGHAGTIQGAALSPDGKMFATASEDETIRLWDLYHRSELLTLRGDHSAMNDVAFSPTGELLVSAGSDGTVRVWDGRPRPPPSGRSSP